MLVPDVWCARIHLHVPDAQLCLYATMHKSRRCGLACLLDRACESHHACATQAALGALSLDISAALDQPPDWLKPVSPRLGHKAHS